MSGPAQAFEAEGSALLSDHGASLYGSRNLESQCSHPQGPHHPGHALGIPVSEDSFPDDREPPSEHCGFLPEVFPTGARHTC